MSLPLLRTNPRSARATLSPNESIETTSRYLHPTITDLSSAAAKLDQE